jgi:ribosomal protein L18E
MPLKEWVLKLHRNYETEQVQIRCTFSYSASNKFEEIIEAVSGNLIFPHMEKSKVNIQKIQRILL